MGVFLKNRFRPQPLPGTGGLYESHLTVSAGKMGYTICQELQSGPARTDLKRLHAT